MKRCSIVIGVMFLMTLMGMAAVVSAAEQVKIAIMQAQAGDARKYQPLLDYLEKKGIPAKFVTASDYTAAADMFAKGSVDAMFSGSGIAGCMIIKELANPLVRPVSADGTSTYSAVVIAQKGAPNFTGSADYFNGKRVIFSSLASSGEFYFHSLGPSKPKEVMKAASHGAALDALSRGQADVAIIKNHVWTKEKDKYPQLVKVGEDKGENPDNTLIVSKKMDAAMVQKISATLLGIQSDSSQEAAAAKTSLKVKGFMKTTQDDFRHTLSILKKAGVTKSFNFRF